MKPVSASTQRNTTRFNLHGRPITHTSLLRALEHLPSPRSIGRRTISILKRKSVFDTANDNPNQILRTLCKNAEYLCHYPTWTSTFQRESGVTINCQQQAKRLLKSINKLIEYKRHTQADLRGRELTLGHERYVVSLRALRAETELLLAALNPVRIDLQLARRTWNSSPELLPNA